MSLTSVWADFFRCSVSCTVTSDPLLLSASTSLGLWWRDTAEVQKYLRDRGVNPPGRARREHVPNSASIHPHRNTVFCFTFTEAQCGFHTKDLSLPECSGKWLLTVGGFYSRVQLSSVVSWIALIHRSFLFLQKQTAASFGGFNCGHKNTDPDMKACFVVLALLLKSNRTKQGKRQSSLIITQQAALKLLVMNRIKLAASKVAEYAKSIIFIFLGCPLCVNTQNMTSTSPSFCGSMFTPLIDTPVWAIELCDILVKAFQWISEDLWKLAIRWFSGFVVGPGKKRNEKGC